VEFLKSSLVVEFRLKYARFKDVIDLCKDLIDPEQKGCKVFS